MAPGGPEILSSADSKAECLFSLEMLVHDVRVDCATLALREMPLPTVAFRLLEFPTVLLYPKPGYLDEDVDLDYAPGLLQLSFDRGKSCMFRQSISSLHRLLSNTPLYVLLLDLRPNVPLLLGSCLISLSETVMLLKEALEKGNEGLPAAPCWKGHSGRHMLHDLMGRKVGSISLSYRLLCLGESVVGHMQLNREPEEGCRPLDNAPNGSADCVPENRSVEQMAKVLEQIPPPVIDSAHSPPAPTAAEKSIKIDNKDPLAKKTKICRQNQSTVPTMAHQEGRCSSGSDVGDRLSDLENEANVHCPPPLYYHCNSKAELVSEELPEVSRSFGGVKVNAEEDHLSEAEPEKVPRKNINHSKPTCNMNVGEIEKTQLQQQTRSALSQLPLLNALLLELSVLNDQLPRAAEASISSRLAWLYTNGANAETIEPKSPSLEKAAKKPPSPKIRRNKPEGFSRSPSATTSTKEQEKSKECINVTSSAPQANAHGKKKLIYGITNTFKLRLQQTNPNVLLKHERREQRRKELIEFSQQKKIRQKGILSKGRISQSSVKKKQKGGLHRSLDENVETLIQGGERKIGTFLNHEALDANIIESHWGNFATKGQHGKRDGLSMKNSTSVADEDLERHLKLHLSKSSLRTSEVSDHEDLNHSHVVAGRNTSSSPNGRVSADLLASQDYTGYSDDFTSVDFTGRYSDAFDSSPEPVLPGHNRDLSNSDSESGSNSNYNSVTPSISTPQPTVSNASPVQSYKTTMRNQKRQQIRIPLAVSYRDDNDDQSDKNSESGGERSKHDKVQHVNRESPRLKSGPQRDDALTESESYSYDKNISARTSKVSVLSNLSGEDVSSQDSTTQRSEQNQTQKSLLKNISDIQVNKLQGYTL
ncbi:microtubule-associated protein 10 [Spea bombifrons]|uniref:microtubule-associated protein 10 n=1 Tax=Spea bombifrons TaxID=233779 RepID=UPI00234BD46C|nr:microtubule-associated protein 10 [Spea bombifrons]